MLIRRAGSGTSRLPSARRAADGRLRPRSSILVLWRNCFAQRSPKRLARVQVELVVDPSQLLLSLEEAADDGGVELRSRVGDDVLDGVLPVAGRSVGAVARD